MTPLLKITPEDRVLAFLRNGLTDHKTGRTLEWIVSQRPDVNDVNLEDNFPMISVEQNDINFTGEMGMDCSEQSENVDFIINVWTKRREIITVESYSEDITFTGTGTYSLTNYPVSLVTGIVDPVSGEDLAVTSVLLDEDDDEFYDSVQLTSSLPSPTSLMVNTSRVAEGLELAVYIAQEVHELLRDGWRDAFLGKLFDYRRMSLGPPPFEDNIRMFRCELHIRFEGVNLGD